MKPEAVLSLCMPGRGSLLPDPRYDAVRAVFLAVMDDVEECPDGLYTARLLLFDETGTAAKDALTHVQVYTTLAARVQFCSPILTCMTAIP